MFTIILFIPSGGLLLFVSGIYMELEPAYPYATMLVSFLPSIFRPLQSTIAILIRITHTWFQILEIINSILIYFMGALLMLVTLNASVKTLSTIVSKAETNDALGFVFFSKIIQLYKMIQIYLQMHRPIYSAQIPTFIFCGSAIIVLANFATIKMYDLLGLPLYLVAPMTSFFVISCLLSLLPQAILVYSSSCEFH